MNKIVLLINVRVDDWIIASSNYGCLFLINIGLCV